MSPKSRRSRRLPALATVVALGALGLGEALAWERIELPELGRRLELHNPTWAEAPRSWHLGSPLANGELGVMAWGDGAPLWLTLDRYDVWEYRTWRPDPLHYNYLDWRERIEAGRAAEIREELQTRHWAARDRGDVPSPTRLPLGRLALRLGSDARVSGGVLDLLEGCARFRCRTASTSETDVRVLAHATRTVILVEVAGPGARGARWSLEPPRLGEREARRLEQLGYKAPRVTVEEGGRLQTQRWKVGGDREVATLARELRAGEDQLWIAISIRIAPPQAEAVELARQDVDRCRTPGGSLSPGLLEGHQAWWREFWSRSGIRIPDLDLESLWYRGLYQLGSLSRPGKFPISLQGVWSQDGGLPPWAGDYHLDVNVQECYWPVYATNHLEQGLPLYERFFQNLPRYRGMCRDFFGFDGCYTRCEQALDGSPIFGYYTTNFWAGNGPWLAHHFWLHWRYSLDFEFLKERAFPFLRSCMDLYLGLLEKGDDGYYHLPLTNSPEFHEDRDTAWGADDAGNLSLIRFLAKALLEADRVLGASDPARPRWEDILLNLAPIPGTSVDPGTGELRYRSEAGQGILVMANRPYDIPHRHLTHLLGIYPLGLLHKGLSPDVDRLIDDSLDTVLRQAEPIGDWSGWTFPWASLLASHSGRPERAVELLHRFRDGHTYPNGLHENGDWKGVGTTRLRYAEPTVTVEGSLAAAAAVTDLLIQSDGGRIRLFPGVPAAWQDASFTNLRAEGAFVVSAALREGKLDAARIRSEKGGRCRLAGISGQPTLREETGSPVTPSRDGDALEFLTRPGVTYVLGW